MCGFRRRGCATPPLISEICARCSSPRNVVAPEPSKRSMLFASVLET
jgi:hypothetical protein